MAYKQIVWQPETDSCLRYFRTSSSANDLGHEHQNAVDSVGVWLRVAVPFPDRRLAISTPDGQATTHLVGYGCALRALLLPGTHLPEESHQSIQVWLRHPRRLTDSPSDGFLLDPPSPWIVSVNPPWRPCMLS
jgi:hypothetical protein